MPKRVIIVANILRTLCAKFYQNQPSCTEYNKQTNILAYFLLGRSIEIFTKHDFQHLHNVNVFYIEKFTEK